MEWNEKVKELMKVKGINQKQLSMRSGIAESSISRYLSGDRVPRMDVIVNVAKALDVSTEYFLEEDQKCDSAYTAISTFIINEDTEWLDPFCYSCNNFEELWIYSHSIRYTNSCIFNGCGEVTIYIYFENDLPCIDYTFIAPYCNSVTYVNIENYEQTFVPSN